MQLALQLPCLTNAICCLTHQPFVHGLLPRQLLIQQFRCRQQALPVLVVVHPEEFALACLTSQLDLQGLLQLAQPFFSRSRIRYS